MKTNHVIAYQSVGIGQVYDKHETSIGKVLAQNSGFGGSLNYDYKLDKF